VVDQDTTHHFRRQREEVRAILPIGVTLVDESQVRFMDQSRRLQEVSRPLPTKAHRRPTAEFLMNHTNQFIARSQIASTPRVKEARQVVLGSGQVVLNR
jgi:hypothetical protein